MFDLTTYVKKWRIRQLKTVFSTLDTLWNVVDYDKVQPILQILNKKENHVNLVLDRCTISVDAWIAISRVASL